VKLTLGCTTRPYSNLGFAEICQRIAAAGYTDVAVFSQAGLSAASTPQQVKQVRQTALDAGLTPSLVMGRADLKAGLAAATDEWRRWIGHAAALGAKWLLSTGVDRPELYETFFALLAATMPDAAQATIGVQVKPHGGITLTSDDLIRMVQRVNHPAFSICYDPGNIIYYSVGAERPETNLARVVPFAKTAIIKDCIIVNGKPDVMVTPGEGLVDFPAVLGGLVRGGFRGPMYLECVGGQTIDEIDANVRRTRGFVQGLLDQIGA
jgi:sugar phosphate isomerase/epimerase